MLTQNLGRKVTKTIEMNLFGFPCWQLLLKDWSYSPIGIVQIKPNKTIDWKLIRICLQSKKNRKLFGLLSSIIRFTTIVWIFFNEHQVEGTGVISRIRISLVIHYSMFVWFDWNHMALVGFWIRKWSGKAILIQTKSPPPRSHDGVSYPIIDVWMTVSMVYSIYTSTSVR